jgi:anti-sigma factor RsiW
MNRFLFHLPFDQLADYVEGRLAIPERKQLEAHLSVCVMCSAKVMRMQRLVELMRTDTSEDAPPSLIARVKDLFRSHHTPQSRLESARTRILAALSFDSLGMRRAVGVRSGKPGTRQLLFSTGVDEIDLRIEPEGDSWTVSGQVLGESAAGGRAVLQSDMSVSQAELNGLSEFVLPSVQAGIYKLILDLEHVEVEIEELKVGP